MAIRYQCRYCSVEVGRLEENKVNMEQLGFNHLDQEERMDMITYLNNGDMEVKTVCEDCQEALERNPEFHSLHNFIQ